MKLLRRGTLFALLAFAGACGGGGSTPPPAPVAGPLEVPAGVDSTVAAAADALADESFVSMPEQDEALLLQEQGRVEVERTDSLWLAMSALLEEGAAVSGADSAAAFEEANRGGEALLALDNLLRSSNTEVATLAAETERLLNSAQGALERSFQLNPFDTRTQVWLAQVYGLQARRLGQVEAYDDAIRELEKLALLTPDQHTVYAMLANNYFYVENWDGAALNYQKAEDVYLATYDLTVEEVPPLDSTVVFSYIQAQGDMHVQRLAELAAADAYDRALVYATTPDDSAYIAGEREWMAWDDGNLSSSFARDSLLALEESGDLEGARRGYLALLPSLSASRAVDETEWRLSIVDYNVGNTDDAASRLQSVVQRTATGSDGMPLDPAYARYFDDYGTLCLNLGRSARAERRDARTALMYFTQATEIEWSGKAVAHYEVARLVQSNLPVALEHASQADEGAESLEVAQRLDLYRLLMELHRRTGDFDQARRYRDAFTELRASTGR